MMPYLNNEGLATHNLPTEGDNVGRSSYLGLNQRHRLNCNFTLSKYTVYGTGERMYVVGSNRRETMFRILEIDLTVPEDKLSVLEDNVFFSRGEVMNILSGLEDAYDNSLNKLVTGYGLLGFIRFTSCYYLIVITECSQVAIIGGHSIFHIDGTEIIPISKNYKKPDKYSNEGKLLTAFQNLDLTKTFYFSYTYDITNTLQTNLLRQKLTAANRGDISIPTGIYDYNEMFMWNQNLLSPLFDCLDTVFDWFQVILHGFIDQVNILISSKSVYVTMVARRSRHFAGARFLKRGVNKEGYVANEVETEQIVSDMMLTSFHSSREGFFDSDRYTSFVQHRGSIPLYWTQDSSNLTAKPPIEVNLVDPYYLPAALHFDKLYQRYGGGKISVLNLIKVKEKIPRETKLLTEFETCISYLNKFLPEEKKIKYTSWDMSRASKQDGQHVIEFLEDFSMNTVNTTGIFHNGKDFKSTKIQEGICRSNCIDCLDRTNAAQFIIGKRALGEQLKALGIVQDSFLEYDSDIVNILTELFHDLGDTIALQYGGSHLVNTMETYRKINQWRSHSRDMIESIKRFYSNSFVDAQRQEAINLFLGHYVKNKSSPVVWDTMDDGFLNNDKEQEKKRSYTHWWNIYHIKSLRKLISEEIINKGNDVTLQNIVKNIRGYPDAFDNYWNEYYLPKSISHFQDLFTYNMNSTRHYHQEGNLNKDLSPFKSRKATSINNKLRELRLDSNLAKVDDDTNGNKKISMEVNKFELDLYEQSYSTVLKDMNNLKATLNQSGNGSNNMPIIFVEVEDAGTATDKDYFNGQESKQDLISSSTDKVHDAGYYDNLSVDKSFYKKIFDIDDYKGLGTYQNTFDVEKVNCKQEDITAFTNYMSFNDKEIIFL
ncbi:hypothetical protein TPHA_0P01540 [Tetrapisispora phaffii CBS 4417]|uniref:SAC domain-containing protein n=1 Tax=Tetrapisispora phaffii (strain ATCC 24235 / CBS 4417 / NBRC 1672 / NRRL Y-8282 / UCD 70-5) TaxID=1071381 RepID=G8C2D4_TETPH|nr:hypothetical protein TPHA_0P01540 [Tetrapisispora phaffii CBS 4417]CCE66312.1 hypothetical protein TPHA_0P01540 [Tetrapisispora phaffii CBS 4417]